MAIEAKQGYKIGNNCPTVELNQKRALTIDPPPIITPQTPKNITPQQDPIIKQEKPPLSRIIPIAITLTLAISVPVPRITLADY